MVIRHEQNLRQPGNEMRDSWLVNILGAIRDFIFIHNIIKWTAHVVVTTFKVIRRY